MKAEEAREISKSINSGQLNDIMRVIKIAADRGEYFCWYYREFKEKAIRDQLKSLGYTVGETQYERSEIMTKISWA